MSVRKRTGNGHSKSTSTIPMSGLWTPPRMRKCRKWNQNICGVPNVKPPKYRRDIGDIEMLCDIVYELDGGISINTNLKIISHLNIIIKMSAILEFYQFDTLYLQGLQSTYMLAAILINIKPCPSCLCILKTL